MGPWQQLRALRGHGCAHAPTKTLASHAAHLGGSVGSVPSLSVLTSMGVGAAAAAAASAAVAAASAAAAAAAIAAALGCLLAAAGRCFGAGPRLTGFFRRRALWRSSCRDGYWNGRLRGAHGMETKEVHQLKQCAPALVRLGKGLSDWQAGDAMGAPAILRSSRVGTPTPRARWRLVKQPNPNSGLDVCRLTTI